MADNSHATRKVTKRKRMVYPYSISDAIERIDRERDSIPSDRCWLCKHGPPCFTCEMDLTTTNNKG